MHDAVYIIEGKRWRFIYAKVPGRKWAITDYETRTVTLSPSLRKYSLLAMDTILHELRHIVDPTLSEDHINETSTKIAQILWSQGFRLIAEDLPPPPGEPTPEDT